MNISFHSKNKLMQTFAHWQVAETYADPMYNYLVHGHSPGSFFESVLANDFASAIARSHPVNTIIALKALVGWIRENVPSQARDSYEAVSGWSQITPEQRRIILEQYGLIFTVEEEVMKILKDEPSVEPVLY
jgi:hypothetical protein